MLAGRRSFAYLAVLCLSLGISCQKRLIPTRIDIGSLPPGKTVETTANNRFFPDKIIYPPLEIEHDFKLSSAPKEKLATIGHILFVPTKDGRVESIDLNAKKKIGRLKVDQGIQANVIPIERNLLLSLEFGKKSLHLFSPSENKYLWTVELGSIKTYPVIHEDKILVASLYRGIFCVNAGDGGIIWNTSLKSQLHSSPVIYGSFVMQGTESGVVASLSLETGDEKWRVELEDPILASPIAIDSKIIFCTNLGRIAALSPDGEFIWQKKFDTAFRRTPVAAEGKLIIAGQDGIVRALSLDDGTLSRRIGSGDCS